MEKIKVGDIEYFTLLELQDKLRYFGYDKLRVKPVSQRKNKQRRYYKGQGVHTIDKPPKLKLKKVQVNGGKVHLREKFRQYEPRQPAEDAENPDRNFHREYVAVSFRVLGLYGFDLNMGNG